MKHSSRKPCLAAALALLIALPQTATARDESLPLYYFGPFIGYTEPDSARDADHGLNYGVLFGYEVADSVGIELHGFGQQTRRTSDGRDDYSHGAGLDLALGAPLPGNLVFLIGGGYIHEDIQQVDEDSGFANLGIGGYLPVSFQRELWRVELRYNVVFNEKSIPPHEILEDLRVNVGMLFGFGQREPVVYPDEQEPLELEPPPPVPPPPMADTDGDGVADAQDECPGTPRWVRPDPNGCTPDSDGDGVDETLDCCPSTPRGATVDAQGCEVSRIVPGGDEDGDGIPDEMDQCPHTPPGLAVDHNGCVIVQDVVLQSIHFELDSDVLSSSAYRILNSVAASVRQQPTMVVEIGGHADASGGEKYNIALSRRRADVVRDFLIYLGVPSERLTAVGHGESQPIADNSTPEGRAQNRRVEFKVLSQ